MAKSRHRLLMVESDPLLAEVTSYRLQLLGYRVLVAETTAELWTGVDKLRPHAVLMNLDVDDLHPMELLEQLASDTSTAELPIIALSKHSDLDQVERVWKNGVSDYLVTPYDPVILERKVARLLSEVPLTSDSDNSLTTDGEEIETASIDSNVEPAEVGV
jgi:DNA-binding response OmpR family regulator